MHFKYRCLHWWESITSAIMVKEVWNQMLYLIKCSHSTHDLWADKLRGDAYIVKIPTTWQLINSNSCFSRNTLEWLVSNTTAICSLPYPCDPVMNSTQESMTKSRSSQVQLSLACTLDETIFLFLDKFFLTNDIYIYLQHVSFW